MNTTFGELYKEASCIKNPHCLVELSEVEWRRMKPNSITTNSKSIQIIDGKRIYHYNDIKYGTNVNTIKRIKKKRGYTEHFLEIELRTMVSRYIIIVAPKSNFADEANIIICNSSSAENYAPSGMLLLCLCVDKTKSGVSWGQDHCNIVKASKRSVITSKITHNNSTGLYYSYGNKGNFGLINDSSVSQYTYKKYKSEWRNEMSHSSNNFMQQLSAEDLLNGLLDMSVVLPAVGKVVSPIIDAAFEMQKVKGNIELSQVPGSSEGLWQTSICINAETHEFHTEEDCTYTVIKVPKHEKQQKKNCDKKYNFIFQLDRKHNIGLPMTDGVAFLFSGSVLTHRQSSTTLPQCKDGLFFNIASYGNKKLFTHIKKSFERKSNK